MHRRCRTERATCGVLHDLTEHVQGRLPLPRTCGSRAHRQALSPALTQREVSPLRVFAYPSSAFLPRFLSTMHADHVGLTISSWVLTSWTVPDLALLCPASLHGAVQCSGPMRAPLIWLAYQHQHSRWDQVVAASCFGQNQENFPTSLWRH